MNRSNVGNQVANGVQVLSVGGFTGGNWASGKKRQRLADASSALNNMSEDEVRQVGQSRAEDLRQQIRRSNNKTDGLSNLSDEEQKDYGKARAEELKQQTRRSINKTDGLSNLSDDEQKAYGQKKADDLRAYINNSDDEEEQTVDELVSSIKSTNSPQAEELSKAIKTNSEYLKKRNLGKGENGRFVSLKQKNDGGDK